MMHDTPFAECKQLEGRPETPAAAVVRAAFRLVHSRFALKEGQHPSHSFQDNFVG